MSQPAESRDMSDQSDPELFDLMRRRLYSAVIGDVLDSLGYLHQFLPPQIQPLRHDMRVVGRAMPVLEVDIVDLGRQSPLSDKPYGLMFEALDNLKPDEVYVAAGASATYALWGELMTTRAQKLGCVGAVLDGASRDTLPILDLDFPVFSRGRYAQDQGPRGQVVDYRVPVEIGGVRVRSGDILFGDLDGVVVIPRLIEQECIHLALEKASGENLVRKALEDGMSAVEAFRKYGFM